MARRGQIWKIDPKTNELVKIQDIDNYGKRVHFVMPDIQEYVSPVTLKRINGRTQQREDLKVTGCRQVDPSEKKEFMNYDKPEAPMEVDTESIARRFDQIESMSDREVLRERQMQRRRLIKGENNE